MSSGKGQPIHINTTEFLRRSRSAGVEATGMVVALLTFGNGQPFAWDTRAVAQFLTREHPRHPMTPAALEGMRESLLRFFVVLADGRWAPDPAVFSPKPVGFAADVVDGNPGTES